MKQPFIVALLLLLALGAFIGVAIKPATADAVMNIREFQVTTDSKDQYLPDIDGYHIVYQDNRNGNWDIYLFTLLGSYVPESQVTTNASNQTNPAISGNYIVWQDDRNGNWDIYLYDIETQTETRITNNTAAQVNPAIDGNRVVWQDNRNGNEEIYLYDLAAQTETRITYSTASQYPSINGNHLTYRKTTGQWYDVIYYDVCVLDFTTWREISVSASFDYFSSSQPQPVVFGDRVAFVAQHGSYPNPPSNSDIVLKDLNNPYYDEWSTVSTAEQLSPDLYCEPNLCYLVWQDNRNGNWDIYVYNVLDDMATQVTNNTAGQQNPVVYGGRIVFQDDRNGNWDIYMAELSYSNPTPVPTTPAEPGGPIGGPQKGRGALYISSVPSGAIILINGTEFGVTNKIVSSVPAGIRNLTLTKPGYLAETVMVDVPATGVKVLPAITLSKEEEEPSEGTGALYISSVPTGATILINGTEFGVTNKIVSSVPAGIRNLTLTKPGYLAETVIVDVPEGRVDVLPAIYLTEGEGEPSEGTGTLYVASHPSGASIFINGTGYGMTDIFLTNVPAGSQNLTLTKEGYQQKTLIVHIPAGGVKVLEPISLTKGSDGGDGIGGEEDTSGGETTLTADVLHGGNVAGQIVISNIDTTRPTYSVTVQGLQSSKQYWLFYRTASGDKKFITTDYAMKGGIWRQADIWTHPIDDLRDAPIFILQDVSDGTSLALTVSKTNLEVSGPVTFTATLIQRDLKTGDEVPLNDQEVYIIGPDLIKNLCTPGPNGTYTWTTEVTSLGSYTYRAAFFATKAYLASSSNEVTISYRKPTDLILTVSNTRPKVTEPVTFTVTLFQGNQTLEKRLPLSDQNVSIVADDGSEYLCTPGEDGTYLWSWNPAPGANHVFHAVFDGNDQYLPSSSNEVKLPDFPTLTAHYTFNEGLCKYSWVGAYDCIYTRLTFSGTLKDPGGIGIPNKTIQLYTPDHSSPLTDDLGSLMITTTDGNGNWQINWQGVSHYNWLCGDHYRVDPPVIGAYFAGDETYGDAWNNGWV